MLNRTHLVALAALAFVACAAPNEEQAVDTTTPQLQTSYTVAIQGFDGTYVACELALDSADKGKLVSSRTSPGDWEKFTLFELGDNKIALQAANGKYVCCDDYRAGLLVADRDQIGDWETFTLVPQENGTVALQAWNKRYVTAEYSLPDAGKGTLLGIREEIREWERFTLVKDLPAVQ
ncbi:MAG TPA: hypothetical protein PLB89_09135 [Flavobacteriales bacterium]|nr:hypothetical protein [Flavobacteriales bacterium]